MYAKAPFPSVIGDRLQVAEIFVKPTNKHSKKYYLFFYKNFRH
jgi:hypothetical protein